MSTTEIAGDNYSLKEGVEIIEFFGYKGFKLSDESWFIVPLEDDERFMEIDPNEQASDSIRGCIQEDVESGSEDKIAQLHLCPEAAVLLFLEGKLTKSNLRKAVEKDGLLEIPKFNIEDRTLTLKVIAGYEYDAVTADNEGNML